MNVAVLQIASAVRDSPEMYQRRNGYLWRCQSAILSFAWVSTICNEMQYRCVVLKLSVSNLIFALVAAVRNFVMCFGRQGVHHK